MTKDNDLNFLPLKLEKQLMHFQKEGIKFALRKNGRCLIADEMGLGKTIQAISSAYFYQDEWPLLIVVPASLRYPWIEEIEKWLPHIHPHDINLIQSCSDVGDISSSKITIVTYGLLRLPSSKILREAICNQNFKVAIVDESHYMKNRKSATTKFLLPLLQNIDRKFLLSGTPALARPEELYPQLSALLPSAFGNWSTFANKYCDAHMVFFGKRRQWVTSGASNLEELQARLKDKAMIRRLKKDVLTQLPPKQRQRIPFEIKDSELKKDLDSKWDSLNAAMGRSGTNVTKVMEGQAAPTSNFFEIRKSIMGLYQDTCKVKLGPVREYVKMLCENRGFKFLVFAHHHVMMNSVAEQLHEDKVNYIRIDGNTLQQDRPRLVQQFQVDPETRVALLSIQAAGVGITLTAAQLVVFAELDWTPGKMEQAEDRAHRIGQQSTVHVHYLVAKGTLDEWFWSALSKKTLVVTTTLNGQTKELSMDQGHETLTSCLTNADTFIPKKPGEDVLEDVSNFFASQQPRNQRSVLDYFTPKGKSPKKRQKKRVEGPKESGAIDVLTIEDSDGEKNTSIGDFQGRKSKRKKRKLSDFSPLVYETNMPDISDSDINKSVSEASAPCSSSSGPVHDSPSSSALSDFKAVEEELDSRWSCLACTFLNHDGLPFCEICSTPKPKGQRRSKRKLRPSNDSSDEHGGSVSFGFVESDKPTRKSRRRNVNRDFENNNGFHGHSSEGRNSTKIPTFTLSKPHSDNRMDTKEHSSINDNTNNIETCCFNIDNDEKQVEGRYFKNDVSRIHGKSHDISESESEHKDSLENDNDIACKANNGSSIDVPNHDNNQNTKRKLRSLKEITSYLENENKSDQSERIALSDIDDGKIFTDSDYDAKITSVETYSLSSTPKNSISERDLCSSQSLKKTPKRFRFRKTSSICGTPQGSESGHLNDSQSMNSGTLSSQHPSQENLDCDTTPCKLTRNAAASSILTTPSSQNDISTNNKRSMLESSSVNENDLLLKEIEAAQDIFSSPSKQKPLKNDGNDSLYPWKCPKCDLINDEENDDCDGCLATRPEEMQQGNDIKSFQPERRSVNLDQVKVYKLFKFCCSKNTNRIYLYDENGDALNENFTVLDVEMDNFAQLPDLLLHPENLKHIKRFVREWKNLSPTKRRVVIKSGVLFTSPTIVYEELKNKTLVKQRYMTKDDVAIMAKEKAESVGGSVRVISRPPVERKRKKTSPNEKSPRKGVKYQNETDIGKRLDGITQALDADGRPLCVLCHKPYNNDLIAETSVQDNAWYTRFCSKPCSEQYWLQRHRSYGAEKVFEEEHGICQICGFDVNAFFTQIRVTTDYAKRAKLIKESKFNCLKPDIKEKMVKKPYKGLFWQIDHITPVVEGGGMCDIDNLRTLCTLCHRDVTSQQNRDRAKRRRLEQAADNGDITAFFKPV